MAAKLLEGRHALVTGGSRGIGLAVAETLSAHGAAVSVVGRDEKRVAETARTLPRAQGLVCDVCDEDAVVTTMERAAKSFGTVELLVNNAGAAESAPFTRTDLALWRRMLEVNLTGVFLCTRAALPGMRERGFGRIVSIASTAGLKGYPYVAAYCAAKHGVVGLTRSLALEVATQGVTVNAVCPGYTDTDLLRDAATTVAHKSGRLAEDVLAEFARSNPQARLVHPREVANTVAWLCLPGSEAINGQAIAVAGGEL
ncbi:MAG: SDR family NAD(P)-dependent oxidoreductase [Gammaproteobacteria bacterium]|nr:SDR family NAD(P)-dependent oxidoreductase [Gammaproteobacteria bacterium]